MIRQYFDDLYTPTTDRPSFLFKRALAVKFDILKGEHRQAQLAILYALINEHKYKGIHEDD